MQGWRLAQGAAGVLLAALGALWLVMVRLDAQPAADLPLRLPLPAAVAVLLGGLLLVAHALWRQSRSGPFRAHAVSLALGALVLAGSATLWLTENARQELQLRRAVRVEATQRALAFKGGFERRILALEQAASRWSSPRLDPALLVAEEQNFLQETYAGVRALGWVPGTARPDAQGVPPALEGAPAAVRQAFRDTAQLALRRQAAALSPALPWEARQWVLLVVVPVGRADRPRGVLLGVLDVPGLFDAVIEGNLDLGFDYAFTVREGQQLLYRQLLPGLAAGQTLTASEEINLRGRVWRFEFIPADSELARLRSPLPLTLLSAGMVLALAVVLLAYGLFAARQRSADLLSAVERQQLAEQGLRRSERLLQTVVDTIPYSLSLKDREGHFVLANAAFFTETGFTREDFVRQTVGDLRILSEEDKAELARADQIVLGTGRLMTLPDVSMQLGGEEVFRTFIKAPWLDDEGRSTGVVTVTVDTTERYLAMQELAANRRQLRTVFDALPARIQVRDAAGRLILVNEAQAAVCGTTPDAYLHLPEQYPHLQPDDEARMARLDAEVLSSGEMRRFHGWRTNRQGVREYVETRKIPLTDEAGTLTGMISVAEDFTAQREAEEAVHRMGERYRDLVEASTQGIVIFREFKPLFANAAAAMMYGFETPDQMMALPSLTALIDGDQRRRVLQGIQQARALGLEVASNFGIRCRRRDGGTVYVDMFTKVVTWDGRPAVQTALINATERLQAEAERRASEERFRNLMEGSIAILIQREGRLLYGNRALAELLARPATRELQAGTPVEPFFVPGGLGWLEAAVPAQGEAPGHVELEACRPDGSRFWVHAIVKRIEWEGGEALQSTFHDITESKRAEQALRLSEAKFRKLIEGSVQGVVVSDRRQRITFANEALLRMFGYGSLQEVMGQHSGDFIAPEHAARMAEYTRQRYEGHPAPTHYEFEGVRKDGSRIWLATTASLAEWDDGPAVLSTLVDVTERKQAEAALAAERAGLEQKVEERTREVLDQQRLLQESLKRLEITNLQLLDANQSKSRFLSTMSHVLRTPLNAILGYTELLTMQAYGPLNEKQDRYLEQVTESGKHLLSLINDLLDISKIDAGAMEVVPTRVNAADLLQGTLNMLGAQFRKKSLQVTSQVAPEARVLHADLRKLRQILLNLLSNAVKYTPEDGEIAVAVQPDGPGWARISVRDSGVGIPPDQQALIFEEFHQVDEVRDAALGGTGIGLALTARLVELHGGQIGVESVPGQGALFWFTMPREAEVATQAAAEGVKKAQEPPPPPAAGRRVLVVEDNPANLELILAALEPQGYAVAVARNGREGLEQASAFRPEMILMDVRMPEMDGLEATRTLRQDPAFAATPILALTASAGAEAEELTLAAGFTAHVAKPIDIRRLLEQMSRHLA